jgi:hypothetical protein
MIKMTLKGAGRRIAYAAVQSELRQGIRAVNARIREERRTLGRDTQQRSKVRCGGATIIQLAAVNNRASYEHGCL